MSEMVERIAQVIGDQMAADANSNEDIARAVLEAMREPTEAMKRVFSAARPESPRTVWHEVITAALKDSSHDG